jgi:HK97 family phage major capsid protein
VQEIKATMVEGQDTLGGFAVPPQIASDTISRMPGMTAIRGGGALVVQTASSMIEWLQLTGGTTRYPTALRGVWGAETQTPASKNLTFGLLQIPVQVYTFKVPMSVSLIEDASNLVDVFVQNVSQTLSIDEDEAFIIGDGANKPRGLLPGSANAQSLQEVISGASTLTWAGVRNLRHGVSAQYRQNTTYIGNGATAGVIEGFTDGTGRPYVEFLEPGSSFLRGTWRESEAMPDIASSAYPLIFGNLSGYAIVERLGMSIQRYNDSATGINIVEFHVRRRLGGNVIEPWKLCVQKVAAS